MDPLILKDMMKDISSLSEFDAADLVKGLETRLKQALDQLPTQLRKRLMGFIVHRQRKIVRGSLIVFVTRILASNSDQAEEAMNHAYRLAVAVELLHSMTLIHDDLIDKAPLRRGQESYHLVYGKELAIHDGDILYAYALTLVDDMACLQLILKTSYGLALGNLAELEDRITNRFDLEVSHVIRNMERKTALLLSGCVRLGFHAAGRPELFTPAMERAVLDAGIAFQMQDDYLAAFGTTEKFGKAPFWDIQESKRNLFLLFALSSPHRDRIREIYAKPLGEKSSQDICFVLEVYEEIVQSILQLRDNYLNGAVAMLQNLRNQGTDPNEVAVCEFLIKMIRFFVRRDQ